MSAADYEERCQALDAAFQKALAEWLPDPDMASDQEVTDGLAGAISVAGGVFLGLVAGMNTAGVDTRRLAARIVDRLIRINPELEAGGGYGGGRVNGGAPKDSVR